MAEISMEATAGLHASTVTTERKTARIVVVQILQQINNKGGTSLCYLAKRSNGSCELLQIHLRKTMKRLLLVMLLVGVVGVAHGATQDKVAPSLGSRIKHIIVSS